MDIETCGACHKVSLILAYPDTGWFCLLVIDECGWHFKARSAGLAVYSRGCPIA
jgi:hypothetical protein